MGDTVADPARRVASSFIVSRHEDLVFDLGPLHPRHVVEEPSWLAGLAAAG